MSSVVVHSPQKLADENYVNLSSRANSVTQAGMNSLLKADGGTKNKGRDDAFDLAVEKLNRLFRGNHVNVSLIVDISRGTEDVQITDMLSGKTIMRIPPAGIVEMAEKARQNQIGFLMDFLA